MNICKNPECQKEIPNGQNYCNEECLRRYKEIREQKFKEACPESARLLGIR
jgi:hypothetical protein